MVKYSERQLTRTFAALVDPTRRAIIARLALHPDLSVSELERPLPIKLPAVMKHLDVLAAAGLVTRTKVGRTVHCRLTPGPMDAATAWLAHTRRFWDERLDNLTRLVEGDDDRVG